MPHDDWPRIFDLVETWRKAASSLVDQVRRGALSLDDAFAVADGDPVAGRVFAVKVIEVVPEVGKVRARRAMAAVGIADDASLAEVTPEQRVAIGAELTRALAER